MNYRKIKFKWDGQEYLLMADCDLCADVTDEVENTFIIGAKIHKKGVPNFALICKLIAFLINRAGGREVDGKRVSIDPMEIYNTITSVDATKELVTIANSICSSFATEWKGEVDEEAKKT